jgi:S2P endopeptidase
MGFLSSAVLGWVLAFAGVKVADRLTHGLISSALAKRQVVLYLGFVTFSTQRLNGPIESAAHRHRRFFRRWFALGVVLGFCGLLLSLAMLCGNLVSAVAAGVSFEPQATSPLVRGVASVVPLSNATAPASGRAPSALPWLFLERVFGVRDHDAIRNALQWHYDHHHRSDERGFHHLGSRRRRPPAPGGPMDPPHGLNPSDPSLQRPRRGTDTANRVQHQRAPLSRRSLAAAIEDREAHRAEGGGDGGGGGGGGGGEDLMRPLDEGGDVSAHQPLPPPLPPDPDTADGPRGPPRQAEAVHHAEPAASPVLPKSRAPLLTPLVPGVTIPASDVGYIVVAMLVSAVVHELGHALAASMQEAKVDSFGGFLALVFPGAFVQLTGVNALTPFRQLKVWCAGAWHNFVLALVCLAMVSCMPAALSALYGRGSGALVVSLPSGSPLATHVRPGDVIVGLGRFPVQDGGASFRSAVSQLVETGDSAGFCLSEAVFQENAHPASECCDLLASGQEHPRLQCFSLTDGVHLGQRRYCISPAIAATRRTCRSTADCSSTRPPLDGGDDGAGGDGGGGRGTPEKCFIPLLPEHEKLIDIRVRSARTGKVNHFFYQGHPHVLGQSVSVSSYVPRHGWAMPAAVARAVAVWDLPNMLERQLQYLASISLALAILNMAPVFWLDGEASASIFVKLLAPRIDAVQLTRVTSTLLTCGTSLLALNILLALIDT